MGRAPTDTVAAMAAADRIIWTLEPVVCDQCEETCWTLEGRATGDLGPTIWETPISWASHVPQTMALGILVRTVAGQATKLRAREVAAWQVEHQPPLW